MTAPSVAQAAWRGARQALLGNVSAVSARIPLRSIAKVTLRPKEEGLLTNNRNEKQALPASSKRPGKIYRGYSSSWVLSDLADVPESSPVCHLDQLNYHQNQPGKRSEVNISTNKVHFQSRELGRLKDVPDGFRWDLTVPYLAVGLFGALSGCGAFAGCPWLTDMKMGEKRVGRQYLALRRWRFQLSGWIQHGVIIGSQLRHLCTDKAKCFGNTSPGCCAATGWCQRQPGGQAWVLRWPGALAEAGWLPWHPSPWHAGSWHAGSCTLTALSQHRQRRRRDPSPGKVVPGAEQGMSLERRGAGNADGECLRGSLSRHHPSSAAGNVKSQGHVEISGGGGGGRE